MSKVIQTGFEGWVHTQFHRIADETGIDVDMVSEIIEKYIDAMESELTSQRDEDLFATLSNDDGVVSDEQFLRNLSQWIIKWTGNVNVAQRLNIIGVGGKNEIL